MYIIFIEGWVWLKEIVLVCTVFGYIRDMYIYIYTFTNLNDVGIGFVDLYSTSLDERTFKIHWTCREHLVEPQGVKPLRGARGFDFSDFFNFGPSVGVAWGNGVGEMEIWCAFPFFLIAPKKTPFQNGVLVLIGL